VGGWRIPRILAGSPCGHTVGNTPGHTALTPVECGGYFWHGFERGGYFGNSGFDTKSYKATQAGAQFYTVGHPTHK